MTSKRLTPEQVHAVGVAALNNALALMDDARILHAADRIARAYAVGVVGAEEVAKVYQCRRVLQEWTGTLTVAELNKVLRPSKKAHARRHASMLDEMATLARLVGGPPPPGRDNLLDMARNDMRTRELALYVEVAPNGEPITPDGTNKRDADAWMSGMSEWFNMFESTWRTILDDALDDARRRVAVLTEDGNRT